MSSGMRMAAHSRPPVPAAQCGGEAQMSWWRLDSTASFSLSAHAANLNLEAFSFSAFFVSSQIELSVEKIKEAESFKTLTLTCFQDTAKQLRSTNQKHLQLLNLLALPEAWSLG